MLAGVNARIDDLQMVNTHTQNCLTNTEKQASFGCFFFFFFSHFCSVSKTFFLCHEDVTTFPPLAHEDVSYFLCRDMSFNRKPHFCFSCASSAVCFLTPHNSCLLPKWLKGIPPSFCFAHDTPLGF